MTQRDQSARRGLTALREVLTLSWRLLKPNPLRAYVLVYWRIAGMNDTDRARLNRWIEEAA